MPRLSRLTLTVIGVYSALAALVLTTSAWVRDDLRAFRDDIRLSRDEPRIGIPDVRTGAHRDRESWRAEGEAWRAEVRAEREAFESQVLRLIEQQDIRRVRRDGSRDRTSSVGE